MYKSGRTGRVEVLTLHRYYQKFIHGRKFFHFFEIQTKKKYLEKMYTSMHTGGSDNRTRFGKGV